MKVKEIVTEAISAVAFFIMLGLIVFMIFMLG